jgi:hypothetical protein
MDTSTRVLLLLAALAGLMLTVNGCAGSPSAPHNPASAAAPTTASPSASASASVPQRQRQRVRAPLRDGPGHRARLLQRHQ